MKFILGLLIGSSLMALYMQHKVDLAEQSAYRAHLYIQMSHHHYHTYRNESSR